MNIRLHIDRLILDGIDQQGLDRRGLTLAIERQLVERLRAGGLATAFQESCEHTALSATPIKLAGAVDSRGLGTQIAGAVYGSIGAGKEK